MNRRKFILSMFGTAAAGLAAWKMQAGEGSLMGLGKLSRTTRVSRALGADVTLTVYHADEAVAEKALKAAFAEIEAVERVMSLYRADSELSRLNRDGKLEEAHPWLIEVLECANALSVQSGGAFDITVQPLWEVYASSERAGRLPSELELQAALAKVGWEKVEISGRSVRLRGEGTQLTLNGIAQGFAADAVARVLAAHGVEHAMIDTGEVNTLGRHPQKDAWTIGIKHPRDEGAFLALAGLQGRCLATSGDYETRFGNDFLNHHLLDPRTGRSPVELASVSVVARTAMEADALSTAVFMLGLADGRRLVERTEGADALFVLKDGSVAQTDGFPTLG